MNRIWTILLMAIIGIFIEGGILHALLESRYVPHLLVYPLVLVSFYEMSVFGAVQAFLLGLLLDFSSASLIGPWAGAFVSTYACITLVSQRLFVESWIVSCVASFGASLAVDLLYGALTIEFRPLGSSFLMDALWKAAIAALIAGPTLSFCRRLYRGSAPGRTPASFTAQSPV